MLEALPESPPVVAGQGGLSLRAFAAADVRQLERVFADPEIVRWNPGPTDRPGLVTWMGQRSDWSSGAHASWAVADHEGVLAGSVSLHHLDLDQRDSEVGYWVAPWARRRGVARTAVQAATGWAFDVLGLHRVYLYHAVEKVASCRVATTAGFRQEGLLRSSYRYPDGAYHDEHLHARLESDQA